MHSKRILYGGIALVGVLGLILAAAIGYRQIPSVDDQIASRTDLTVRIISPPGESRYPADAAIPLMLVAQGGHEIAALEYWVDGRMVHTEPPAPGNSPVYVVQTWRWMPVVEGEHLITVRAREAGGTVATSNVLRIFADKAAGYWILYTTRQDDTWDTAAAMCKTTIEAMAKRNPELDPKKALPIPIEMWIPCDPLIPSMAAPEGSTPPLGDAGTGSHTNAPPDKAGVWINDNLTGGDNAPAAPGLQAGVNGCTVRLEVADNSKSEQGFTIHRSTGADFEKIATLGANYGGSFTYDDQVDVSGKLQYYVGSFSGAQESQSNIVGVQIADAACGASSSNPNASYADGILSMVKGVDLAYFYASLNNGPWTRVPLGDEFFTPADSKVDLSAYLDPLQKANPQARFADLHLWGWTGGQIEDLGPIRITFDQSKLEYCRLSPAPCTGDVAGTMWSTADAVVGANQPINSQSLTFQFSASAPGATQVLEQISGQPFSETYEPNPAYLIHAEVIGGNNSSGVIDGKFKIQFSDLAAPQGNPSYNLLQPWLNTSPFTKWMLGQSNENAAGPYLDSAKPAEHTYYVRIIPWDGNNPVGKVSNTIAVRYKAVEPSPIVLAGQPPLFDIKIVSFAGEQQIVPEKFGCIRLTELDEAKYVAWLQASILSNPMTGNMQAQIIETLLDQTRQAVAEHRVVCPPEAPWDEGPSIWSDTWDAVTSAWNSIVNLYNELKSGIVFVLANVVNTFTGSCDKTCQDNLRRGLDFAITYFTGIPPNLPTTGDLIDKGLDYAIDAAVQEAGIPCDEICKSAMKTGLKATAEALKQQNSQPGCFGSGIRYGKTAMCLPDGVKGEPIAGAAHTPAGVLVRVTRTNNVPFKGNTAPQLDYVLKISSVNDISALVGQTYQCPYGFYRGPGVAFQQGYVPLPVTEPAQYALYDRVFLPLLADLKQGTTLDLPVVLKPPKQVNFVYQPFQEAINQSNGKLEGIQGPCSQTLLTSPGYSITVTAELICLNAHIPVACPSGDGVTLTDTKTYTP